MPHTPDPFPNFNREPTLTDAELAKVEAVAMRSFTPGPWEIDGFSDCQLITKDVPVAMGSPIGIGKIYGENMHANARLVAAAPDFAAAAARLLAVFDQQRMTAAERIIVGVSDADLRTEGNAAIEALRAALNKATGK